MAVQSAFVIDPQVLFLGPNMAAARNIYDSLVGKDEDAHWTPALAISWKQVAPTVWEFKLRPDVRFSDGSPFTADDVLATLKRIPSVPNNPGPYTSNLRTISHVEAIDPLTLRVTTDQPNPLLPGQFTNIFILPKHVVDATPSAFSSGEAAIGTGPFRVLSFQYGTGMELAPNPNYWGTKPAWNHVQVRVIGNDGAREAALLAGDVDLIENVPPEDVARLRARADIGVFSRPSDRVIFLLPNVAPDTLELLTDRAGNPLPANPMRDLRVRQAISDAIDRRALVARTLSGQGAPTMQLVPEGFGGWDKSVPVPLADTAAAKRALAEAGYKDGFGLTLGCSNDRYVDDGHVCQTIGQMLARAGFVPHVDAVPGSVFFPRSRAGKNEYPLILYGLSLSSLRDGAYILQVVAHGADDKRALGDSNRGGFRDPALDAMIDAATSRSDDGREDAIRAALARTVSEFGIIPLYTEPTIAATRGGITYKPRIDQQMVAVQAIPPHTK
ncbi:MAG: ABC transporter substrate-binding protein [Rhodospirillales bacterium]|nr:ABC transporter substrate-binding protein [Rhodospirillales bacterium]